MTTHSSILAWRIAWVEEPGRLQSKGSQNVNHDWIHIHPSAWPSWQTQYLEAPGSIFPHDHCLGAVSHLPLQLACFPLQGTYAAPKASRLHPNPEILLLFPHPLSWKVLFYFYWSVVHLQKGLPRGSVIKNLPVTRETWVQLLGQEDPWKRKWQPTYSSILAWKIPWTEELGGYSSLGLKESDTNTHFHCLYTSLLLLIPCTLFVTLSFLLPTGYCKFVFYMSLFLFFTYIRLCFFFLDGTLCLSQSDISLNKIL